MAQAGIKFIFGDKIPVFLGIFGSPGSVCWVNIPGKLQQNFQLHSHGKFGRIGGGLGRASLAGLGGSWNIGVGKAVPNPCATAGHSLDAPTATGRGIGNGLGEGNAPPAPGAFGNEILTLNPHPEPKSRDFGAGTAPTNPL